MTNSEREARLTAINRIELVAGELPSIKWDDVSTADIYKLLAVILTR